MLWKGNSSLQCFYIETCSSHHSFLYSVEIHVRLNLQQKRQHICSGKQGMYTVLSILHIFYLVPEDTDVLWVSERIWFQLPYFRLFVIMVNLSFVFLSSTLCADCSSWPRRDIAGGGREPTHTPTRFTEITLADTNAHVENKLQIPKLKR